MVSAHNLPVHYGVRFVEAFALPLSLCAGIFVGFIADYFRSQIKIQTIMP
jgi:dolichyl-diphosphooligosaccharide--protein glycosyltransferase